MNGSNAKFVEKIGMLSEYSIVTRYENILRCKFVTQKMISVTHMVPESPVRHYCIGIKKIH